MFPKNFLEAFFPTSSSVAPLAAATETTVVAAVASFDARAANVTATKKYHLDIRQLNP